MVRLPDNVSDEEGAMLEPLAVAVYSCKRAEVGLGTPVLVLGAGPIGLVAVLTAKAMGAGPICVTGQLSTLSIYFRSSTICREVETYL